MFYLSYSHSNLRFTSRFKVSCSDLTYLTYLHGNHLPLSLRATFYFMVVNSRLTWLRKTFTKNEDMKKILTVDWFNY